MVRVSGKKLAEMVAKSRGERTLRFYRPSLEEFGPSKDEILQRLEADRDAATAADEALWTF